MKEVSHLHKDLSLVLVQHFCPEELPVFDSAFERLKVGVSKPAGPTDPLGSGLGEFFALSTLGSALLVPLAAWLAKDVLGKAVQEFFVEKLKTQLKRVDANKTGTMESASEFTNALPEDVRLVAGVVDRVREQARILGSDPKLVEGVVMHLSLALPAALADARSSASGK
jgi:hypothetical protein